MTVCWLVCAAVGRCCCKQRSSKWHGGGRAAAAAARAQALLWQPRAGLQAARHGGKPGPLAMLHAANSACSGCRGCLCPVGLRPCRQLLVYAPKTAGRTGLAAVSGTTKPSACVTVECWAATCQAWGRATPAGHRLFWCQHLCYNCSDEAFEAWQHAQQLMLG